MMQGSADGFRAGTASHGMIVAHGHLGGTARPIGALTGRAGPQWDRTKHGLCTEAAQSNACDAGLSCKLCRRHGADTVQEQPILKHSRNIVLDNAKSF